MTGTLPVGNGGTGATTFTANGVLYGNTTGAVQVTAAGTNGQLLLGVTAGAPTFATMSSDASITNAGVLTIAADAVALTTDTTGNYVASLTAGNGISGTVASEGATPTLDIDLLVAADGTGVTSSNSGLEFAGASSDKLALIQGCSNGQGISWNDTTNLWECTSFSAGLSGSGTTGYATYWSGTSSLGSEQFLSTVRGGTGLDGSAAANGTLLIGNGTGYTLATLTGTANEIGITNAAGSITIGVPDDGLDFTEFQDTLDLDAALTLNQTTNTWTQSFTGTTTTGFAYTATSLTTGSALNVTTTNTATANTALSPVQFNLTNAQSTTANTNGVTGLAVNFTNNPSVAGNTEYALRIQNQLTANVTDNAVSALLLLDNADSTATGTTIVTDAIAITNSGGSNFTNFLNTPTLDISAAGAITGATGITSSGNITFSSLTANSFLYSGTGGLLTTTTAPTNGQLLIGSTGVAPVAAALTQGTGITVTNGAGSITIASTLGTSVDLTTEVTGTLPVGNGGTGATSLTDLIALTTHTTGNYVANVANGNGIAGGSAGSEGASLTLAIDLLDVDDSTGAIASNSGLEFQGAGSNELTLLQGCADTEILAWDNTTNEWECATVSGVGGLSGSGTTNYATYWTGTSTLGAEAQLDETRGGTGIGTYATGDVLYASGVNTLARLAAGTDGQVLVLSSGVPVWSTIGGGGGGGVTADSLDFTEFQDTLDLDAALTLNQTTNTWTQSFTGTTTTGFAYTATSLTTGSALNVTTTNTATANTALSPVQFNLTNAQSTTANTNGVTGLAVNFTNNPSVAGNTEYALRIQNQLTANVTDNAVSALLLLDNADSTATGTTIVTDAIAITNSGGSNFTNFLNTPTLDISAAGAITGATGITSSGSITFSAFTSNGGPLYTNGSGVIAQTTAGTATQVLHGGTAPSFSAVSLTTDVSGTLPVGNGGTGATTFTANGVLYGNTTGAVQVTAAGTNGQLLLGVTAGAPTFATMSSDASITNAGVLTIAADAVALTTDTTGNYVANVQTSVLTGLTGGSAGSEGASLTLNLDYSQALTGDVALGANAGVFGQSGFAFEGSSADTIETYLVVTNPTASDKTITFPDASGTVVLSGGTLFTAAGTSGSSQTISQGDTLTIAAGTGITTTGGATDTITIASTLGTSIAAAEVDADALDFTEFQDTLDLDAALTLNQTTNTWTQSFTGTTTTGFAYTATSLTTGSALNVTTTNTATANTALSPVQFNLTNAQSTTANTNGVTGLAVNFTNNPSVAGNTEYALRIQNQLTANVTDNAVSALLLLDNADSTATGTTIVTDAIAITNSGGSNFTNFLNTPTLDISAAGAITGATGITSSGNITFSSLTANSFLYSGTGGLLTTTTAPTNGQLLIGCTGVAPVAAALTQGTGITVTNGAGSITIASTLGTSVDLTTEVTGTLPVGNGGTGATTFTANGVLYGNTTGAVQVTAAGTNGQLLLGVTAGAPTFATMSSDASITNAGVLTIAADAVALTTDTTGNYVANVQTSVLTGLTGGSAGSEGASLTLNLDYSQALTGDVALGANAGVFGQSGFAFEGSSADTIETYLVVTNPTASDKTITFPNVSGTIVLLDGAQTLRVRPGTDGYRCTVWRQAVLNTSASTGIPTISAGTWSVSCHARRCFDHR